VFTGLIRHTGKLKERDARSLDVSCPSLRPGLRQGDSVAVSGACLTAARPTHDGFSADLLEETAAASTLRTLPLGRRVNLERPLQAGERFDGHFVQGHLDGTVRLLDKSSAGGQWNLRFELPQWLEALVFPKSSIALDGVSLTVQTLEAASFTVALIPTTYNETSLGDISPGEKVNVEADMLVKAVHRIIGLQQGEGRKLSLAQLKELGF
jgi:riboflavin synthase